MMQAVKITACDGQETPLFREREQVALSGRRVLLVEGFKTVQTLRLKLVDQLFQAPYAIQTRERMS